jgi:glycine betaine/proline transport system substrate-binding protein
MGFAPAGFNVEDDRRRIDMMTFKGRTKRTAVVMGALTLALWLTATGGALAATTVAFGAPPWPGVTVKTEIARQLLEAIGYQTKVSNAGWTIDLQGIARGDIDADLGIWLPTQKSTVDRLVKSGKVKLLTTNVPDAKYDLVVPDYVWKAGVHCICDLNKYADKFDHKIHGIEAGNDGNILMKNAIKHNTYNLGGWHLVPSSTAAMLTEAGRAIDKKQWIVFLGWKPHWMNIAYNLRYLKDPKKIWGGKSTVHTAINPAFAKNNPNVTRFLKQMVVSSKTQSQWIYDYGYEKQSLSDVSKTWIQEHLVTVTGWLEGVETADGKHSAADVIKSAFAS